MESADLSALLKSGNKLPHSKTNPDMIISAIELREIRLPLVHFFETSFGRTTERRIILARITDKDGAEGWGECTAGEGPFYFGEWTEAGRATLEEVFAPLG